MGLDMYLYANDYVPAFDHGMPDERTRYHAVVRDVGLGDFRCVQSPTLEVKVTVAYWRKANQVHDWFVREIQDGRDECREAFVTRDQLRKLVSLCERVLDDRSLAAELLPTKAGFFFGGTEYDEAYFDDLKHTVDAVGPLVDDPRFDGWDFSYRSSW